MFVAEEPTHPLVVMYHELMTVRVRLWQRVLQLVLDHCQDSFMQHSGIARPEYFLVKRQYLCHVVTIQLTLQLTNVSYYDATLTNSKIYSRNILLYYGICRSSSHITASAVLLLALKLCTSRLTN